MQSAQIDQLEANISKLNEWGQNAALSLIKQARRPKGLTTKQQAFALSLLNQSNGVKPTPKTEAVGNMSGLIKIFKTARQHLKFPKIALVVDGHPVRLTLAGSRSKYEGQVQVTDGGSYGNNKWYGRVDQAGTFTRALRTYEEGDKVRDLLVEMATDPMGTAQRHGRLTGNCCFCNSALKDEKSTKVGYGPVCAKRYGLDWGKKA